ncbi:Rpn family recombination-promoting nuclease/putative transposase [Nocardia sp. NPDC004654]|uniref:Rpn family recombination-promoting nuclease/putative transposase n=1 Tax=Nocardia sp. NPDC004654 TaxID=3154776 RepID=UPI0033A7C9D2
MSAAPRSNSHDAYFRHVMGRPADAASELRGVLPKDVAARVDWNGLELQSGSFVSKHLRSRYSDLLFRTRLDGHDAYLYLLIEHQSRSDPLMPLRMLDYLVNIWNHYVRQHPDTRTLPAVVPLVVHSNHTGRRWKAPTELTELIDLDSTTREALDPYLPRFRFLLDDVAALDLPALCARDLTPAARVMLALHKIVPGNTHLGVDLLPLIEDLHAILDGPGGTDEFQCVASYILIVGDTQQADLQPLIDRLGPRAKEAIVTTAERLRAEGRAEGRANALIDLLTSKFGPIPARIADTIHAADPTQVRTWTVRVLTATTLDEVFA